MRKIILCGLIMQLLFAGIGNAAQLIDAIYDEDINLVRQYVRDGADVNVRDNNGDSALQVSVGKLLVAKNISKLFEIIEYLFDNGADVNVKNANGSTVLLSSIAAVSLLDNISELAQKPNEIETNLAEFRLIKNRLIGICRKIIQTSKMVNERDKESGLTSLHMAVISKNTEIPLMLIRYGADVNADARGDGTPLFVAIEVGSLENIKLLIQHGAKLDFRSKDGETPMVYAKRKNCQECMSIIMAAGGA